MINGRNAFGNKVMLDYQFHCSRLGFEPMWMTDKRKWSKSDYILWVKISQTCPLKCEHCHENNVKGNKWLGVDDLDGILRRIPGRVHISPSLGDILISPYRYEIFDYLKEGNHRINLFSYLPKYVDLRELEFILSKYEFPVCWSLHGENNNIRETRFENPHTIEKVLPILNKRRKYINRVYLFSNNITQQNKGEYGGLLRRLNPDSCEIALTYLIDYHKNIVMDANAVKLPIKHKTVRPNLDILFAIYRRRFSYASDTRKAKVKVRKTNDCQGG